MIGEIDEFFIRPGPRLGLPRLKMADGPSGVRNYGPATTMAAGIALTATWNPELARRVGAEIGRDAGAKGAHFLLGPRVNLYRARWSTCPKPVVGVGGFPAIEKTWWGPEDLNWSRFARVSQNPPNGTYNNVQAGGDRGGRSGFGPFGTFQHHLASLFPANERDPVADLPAGRGVNPESSIESVEVKRSHNLA
jgi:hypothetical protein